MRLPDPHSFVRRQFERREIHRPAAAEDDRIRIFSGFYVVTTWRTGCWRGERKYHSCEIFLRMRPIAPGTFPSDYSTNPEGSRQRSPGSRANATGSHRCSTGSRANATGSRLITTGSRPNATDPRSNATGSRRDETGISAEPTGTDEERPELERITAILARIWAIR